MTLIVGAGRGAGCTLTDLLDGADRGVGCTLTDVVLIVEPGRFLTAALARSAIGELVGFVGIAGPVGLGRIGIIINSLD